MDSITYSRGDVVFAIPPKNNNDGIPITKTRSGNIGGHPIIVLSADASAKTIKGVMVQMFDDCLNLTAVTGLDATLHKWFLPVTPATKESIHEPIPTRPGSAGKAEWVNLKDILPIPENKIRKVLGNVPASTVTAIKAAIVEARK
ncbi:uncharacterized protein LACBIDRAFT_322882 [Laccaria bicolor S238N-H82]|uniref:Predicted protein n=1 Tax=Laccaria bicolor (strain S238N-H82 / ATCC MYA-4686) TaxID=486041 RepID=B0CVF7_LACBS|nr:uncharacterized protein LACBIDRAFT_322882 [Laccaria bicolor S238N-H82]EDR13738.1 predicted protein [Laccaria bicolor S238N-H82]|eukprot:XP_001876236.1 predicted protein [Laccaria bicolor S238N-H82]